MADALHCWLCSRPIGRWVEYHHPVPRSRNGRATVPVHPICHRTLHKTLSLIGLYQGDDRHARSTIVPAMDRRCRGLGACRQRLRQAPVPSSTPALSAEDFAALEAASGGRLGVTLLNTATGWRRSIQNWRPGTAAVKQAARYKGGRYKGATIQKGPIQRRQSPKGPEEYPIETDFASGPSVVGPSVVGPFVVSLRCFHADPAS